MFKRTHARYILQACMLGAVVLLCAGSSLAQDIDPQVAVLPNTLDRISWGGIIAGAIIAMIIQLALNLLFIGIGVSTINPVYEDDSVSPKAITNGAIVSVGLSMLLSLFVGGWLAARFAGIPDQGDGLLHGVMVWGVVMLITTFLLTTAVGRIISGTAALMSHGLRLAGQATQTVAQGVAAVTQTAAQGVATAARGAAQGAGEAARNVAQGAANAAENVAQDVSDATAEVSPELAQALRDRDQVIEKIQEEALSVLRRAGVSPERVETEVQAARADVQQAARSVAKNPAEAEEILVTSLERVFQRGEQVIDQVDRDNLATALRERANLDENQARQLIQTWEDNYNQAREQVDKVAQQARSTIKQAQRDVQHKVEEVQADVERKAEQLRQDAERTARELAQATTQAISRLALAAFAAIVIGVFAAGVGGVMGTPEELPIATIDVDNNN